MSRVNAFLLMLFLFIGVAGVYPVAAQNLFLTPNSNNTIKPGENSNESEAQRPSRGYLFIPKEQRSTGKKSSGKPIQPFIAQKYQNSRGSKTIADAYKSIKGLDLELLRMGGRNPSSQEEFDSLMVAMTTPQITNALDLERTLSEGVTEIMASRIRDMEGGLMRRLQETISFQMYDEIVDGAPQILSRKVDTRNALAQFDAKLAEVNAVSENRAQLKRPESSNTRYIRRSGRSRYAPPVASSLTTRSKAGGGRSRKPSSLYVAPSSSGSSSGKGGSGNGELPPVFLSPN